MRQWLMWSAYALFILCLAQATLNDEFQKLSVKTKLWIVATASCMTLYIIFACYYVLVVN